MIETMTIGVHGLQLGGCVWRKGKECRSLQLDAMTSMHQCGIEEENEIAVLSAHFVVNLT